MCVCEEVGKGGGTSGIADKNVAGVSDQRGDLVRMGGGKGVGRGGLGGGGG